MDMIKEYGVMKCAGRVLYGKIFRFIAPIIIAFLKKKTKVDPKKILFSSAPSFSDNAWFMYEYLYSILDSNYNFVWLSNSIDRVRPLQSRTKNVFQQTFYSPKHTTLKSLREIATSKYIFFTHYSPVEWISPRQGQVVVNLWHGCGIKSVGTNNNKMIKTGPFDVALVPGKAFIETKSFFWRCSQSNILPIGYPRYDCILRDDSTTEQWVNKMKGEKKLVVWMPTFRSTIKRGFPEDDIKYTFDIPLLKNNKGLYDLDKFCSNHNILLCIKRHRLQLAYSSENQPLSSIVFMNNNTFLDNGIELYSFLRYTDALISDYSSVAIDYILLNKPIAYSLDDFEEYKNTRGFVVDNPLVFMPGHHLYNYEDLLTFLHNIADNMDPYISQRQTLLPLVHNPCRNYCERIWKAVKDLEIKR